MSDLGVKGSFNSGIDSTMRKMHESLEHELKTETDPSGKDAHDAGAKLDAGKIMAGSILLQFAKALEEVAEVGTCGANKYSLGGWKSVDEGERRYTDAMLRHLFKEETEGLMDSDLPVKHAAQVAWNALARLHFIIEADNETK